MSKKKCPNCGISVPATAENCSCGFVFVGLEAEVQAPGIVRSGGMEQEGAMAAAPAVPASKPTEPADEPEGSSSAAPRPRRKLLMDCPSCDAQISQRAARCPKCGTEPYGHCGVCAARILRDASPCPECGDPEPFDASA